MAGIKAIELHKASVLRALEPRRDPYWGAPLTRGRFVGYRKIADDRASWIARMRIKTEGEGPQRFHSLGWATAAFGFDEAKLAAQTWFASVDSGAENAPCTVNQAVDEYVANLRTEGREKTATDAQQRLARTLKSTPLGMKKLTDLKADHIKNWLSALKSKPANLKPANANRTLRSLKAALNFAVLKEGRPAASVTLECKRVKPFKLKDARRTLFLDREERRRLLAACGEGSSLRDLLEAAALTGARGGELAGATVGQFEPHSGAMSFTGKTGTREVRVSPAAAALFRRLAQGKRPKSLLFVRRENVTGAQCCMLETRQQVVWWSPSPKAVPWVSFDWGPMVRQAVIAAELPRETVLYTLRHSFISAALSKMTLLDVARMTGTSLLMMEKYYAHMNNDAAHAALSAVEII